MGDISKCLPVILKYEGGFSSNPHDPGGATMCGVTLATYRRFRPSASVKDLKAISAFELSQIYDQGYFQPIDGENLPDGVDLVALDYAVNSGVARAKRALVHLAGLPPKDQIKLISAERLSLLRALSNWRYFGKGWGKRVAGVEAAALRRLLETRQTSNNKVAEALQLESEEASDHAKAISIASTPALIAPAASSHWSVYAFTALVIIFCGFLAWRHLQRAQALAEQAEDSFHDV